MTFIKKLAALSVAILSFCSANGFAQTNGNENVTVALRQFNYTPPLSSSTNNRALS